MYHSLMESYMSRSQKCNWKHDRIQSSEQVQKQYQLYFKIVVIAKSIPTQDGCVPLSLNYTPVQSIYAKTYMLHSCLSSLGIHLKR